MSSINDINNIRATFMQLRRKENAIKIGNCPPEELPPGWQLGVTYTRVSTEMQAEDGNSLEHQKAAVTKYCEDHKIKIVKYYEEPAKSGGTLDRPQLQLMLNELETGMVVVCSAMSRLSRSTDQFIEIYKIIRNKLCKLIVLDSPVDLTSEFGEGFVKLMSTMAEIERKQIKSRISSVMQNMSSQNTLRTKPCYGWKMVDKQLVPIESEQFVISIIRDIINENPNISVSSISRLLSQRDLVGRKGKPLHYTTINSIIIRNNLRPINGSMNHGDSSSIYT
jgi:site-specific DNA recombinase